ncbi:hypothetical protein AcW1_003152 [Taiwanofungus camphoratus]|nr:hypothetical protein AcW1_003152 [Antrodia cinnamomea]
MLHAQDTMTNGSLDPNRIRDRYCRCELYRNTKLETRMCSRVWLHLSPPSRSKTPQCPILQQLPECQ